MIRILATLAIAIFITGCSGRAVDWDNVGAPAGTGFLTKQHEVEGKIYNYTVFVPHAYTTGKKFPVIMFLHGVLEGGSNGKKCVTVGLGPAISERARTFDFIAVFPQSPGDWMGDDMQRVAIATLDRVLADYPAADRSQVFLTGLSNGGDGTWKIGAAYTSRFAGLAPMCSAVDYDDVPKLTKIPIWCFHNSVDPFRSAGRAESMCEKIKAAGGNVKLTKYGDIGHDCWTRAFSEGEVFTWMKAQRNAAVP